MDYTRTDGKPCRACMNVEELMRRARELAGKKRNEKRDEADRNDKPSSSNGSSLPQGAKPMRNDCPLDTEQLGNSTWNFLHTMAAYYPEKPSEEDKTNAKTFMNILGKIYPCSHCAEGLRRDMKADPPKVESRDEFSIWMCNLHNKVSRKLGKPTFDCSKWKERWLDGWEDGSCDY